MQSHILGPLEMKDTSYILPPEKFERLISMRRHATEGAFQEQPRRQPAPPKSFNGGGGLFSTAPDYVRFLQMILREGRGPHGRILEAESVRRMSVNQIGAVEVAEMKTTDPGTTANLNVNPGGHDKYTYGFLLNPAAYEGGRSAGSLAWAGIFNTFYWIDPPRGICAVLLMQFLPFLDPAAVATLRDFEHAVYAAKLS